MTSLVFNRQALGLLFVFVATLFSSAPLSAQLLATDGAILTAKAGTKIELLEYTIIPESKLGARDGYILFETTGTSEDFLDVTAELNGQPIKWHLKVDEQGYARMDNPENGLYQNLEISMDGVVQGHKEDVGVYVNILPFSIENPPVLGNQGADIDFVGKVPEDAPRDKSTGCTNTSGLPVKYRYISPWLHLSQKPRC